MAWEELTAGTSELSVHTDGRVSWNTALQIQLGDPKWVHLLWDPAERRLGVRGVSSTDGLPVAAEPEGSEFSIDAADVLSEAGISVAQTQTGEPEKWYNTVAPGGATPDGTWFGYNPIFHITLP